VELAFLGDFAATDETDFELIRYNTYHDGEHIGVLTVEKLNRRINIFAGSSPESMNGGSGHFSFTGLNSGNTGIVGHNRGRANGFFVFVKDLHEGDILTLEAGGVIRNYAVTMLYTVEETDFSPLLQYGDNRLTLITCVENQRNLRRVAVATE
jgi:LPXTG-site transpeptidase (sortase) family protein